MSFIKEFDLSEETAASFAAGMLKVANADGMIHPKEKVLIEQFSEGLEISDIIDFSIISEGPAAESFMLVTSLVAVSDGEVADSERALLNEFAEKLNCIKSVDQYIQDASLALLRLYSAAELEILGGIIETKLGFKS
jgi:tellurite resistance protein